MLKPVSEIKVNLGIEPSGRVQKFLTDTCAKHMDKYVPKDTGMLRQNISKTSDSITYQSPYAHAQYVGIVNGGQVKNYTTPRNRSILGQKNDNRRKAVGSGRSSKVCWG